MNTWVLGLQEMDRTKALLVGGKGANLGELSKINGIRVPDGFCVTTDAYKKAVAQTPELPGLLEQIAQLDAADSESISELSREIRRAIEETAIPAEIADEIARSLAELGESDAWAVRSSATAEDLATASFAGQQDTYLNVVGREEILKRVRMCWASLFTDRAVTYRIQNGFDHRKMALAVVVQRMIFPAAAGILFTADPITSNRKVSSIDASFGLGEALVSGLVNADNYKVRDGAILEKKIGAKKLAIQAAQGGGTQETAIEPARQNQQVLTDERIRALEEIGRLIELHFGSPQDIEWCLRDGEFFIVQSRPITTLFPIPEVKDGKNHVYMSFSHQQMMTDAMTPFGLSFFQTAFQDKPSKKPRAPYFIPIGGRLYFDLAHDLSSPVARRIMLASMARIDPLVLSALKSLIKRKDFMKSLSRNGRSFFSTGSGYFSVGLVVQTIKNIRRNDPNAVPALIARNEASVREAKRRMTSLREDELFPAIVEVLGRMSEGVTGPRSMGAVFAGTLSLSWVNKNMEKWLGEKGAGDALAKSVPNDVTSAMGLDLLDVADVVRLYPAVVEYLQHPRDETFLADLAELEGGDAVIRALQTYLDKYGMRCPGEIDITRPRFNEQPTALVPMILSNIRNLEPNAHETLFARGLHEAQEKERELLNRLEQRRGGRRKASKARKKISLMRTFIGYREYPKYLIVQYYWIIKQALLREADRLVQEGVIDEKEDIYYLEYEELQQAVRSKQVDYGVIAKRKEEYAAWSKLAPPRVMTSEGEVISGAYETGRIPPGALAGVPASSGVVEGRARVILSMGDAQMEAGDILVTPFTDPSWTPVFVSIKGLVTEVGGTMTHGAIVAREYGLPSVAGVEDATRRIHDGQRIRVNGTEGYVEIV